MTRSFFLFHPTKITDMSYKELTPEEAASLIKHGHHIGLSGFTPAGTAKAVTAELAKIAEAEHAKGNPFHSPNGPKSPSLRERPEK